MSKYIKTNDNGTFKSMWTGKRKDKALHLYVDKKWPLRKVAEFFNCSLGAVQNLMVAEKVIRKRKVEFTKEHKNRIRKLYLVKHAPIELIAKKLMVSEQVLKRFIDEQKWSREESAVREKYYKRKRKQTIAKWLTVEARSYAEYREAAYRLVWPIWHRWHEHIDPHAKRLTDNYHIDHRLSVYAAYHKHDKLDLRIVAHPVNLKALPALRNSHKGRRSSVKLKVLKQEIALFEAQHGKVF